MTHSHEFDNVAMIIDRLNAAAAKWRERAQKAEQERDEARRERDEARRDRAALYDKLNGTPCAEIRWQQERDALRALIARAGEGASPKGELK